MFKRVFSLLKQSFDLFTTQRAASRGAAIAFYVATSLAPVLLIVIAVAGLAFGREAATGAIFEQFRGLLGPDSAEFLQKAIASASDKGASTLASIVSIVALILTASGVFLELEDALNAIWDAKPQSGIMSLARTRVISLGLIVALGFLLMVSLVVDAALKALSGVIDSHLPFGTVLLMAISFVLSLVLIAILFAAIYKLLPAKPLAWRDVWFGAAVTALLFQIGKFLIGLYLGSNSALSSLGAAGALLGLLFWVYYSAQVFLFGAALTRVHSQEAVPANQREWQRTESRAKPSHG